MKVVFSNGNDRYAGPWGFLARVIVMTLATILAAYLLPGVGVESVGAAVATAIVLALLNNFIRPILIVVTLPFTIFSMGLFLLVINVLIIMLASEIVPSFRVDGFWNALLFSILLTVFNYLLELPNKTLRRRDFSDNTEHDDHSDDDNFTPYEEIK